MLCLARCWKAKSIYLEEQDDNDTICLEQECNFQLHVHFQQVQLLGEKQESNHTCC